MFKRFQSPKTSPPFPQIEEDIKCPQCGFDHAGWAFEPGYAKLCVKCGSALDVSDPPECLEKKGAGEGGFFNRVFHGMFAGKQEKAARAESSETPGMKRPRVRCSLTSVKASSCSNSRESISNEPTGLRLHKLPVTLFSQILPRNKPQGGGIDTVPEPPRPRAVGKHVAQV